MLENQPLMGILPICHDTKRQNARIFRSLSLFSPFLNYHDFTEPLMGSILISLIIKWRKIKKFIHQVPAIQNFFSSMNRKDILMGYVNEPKVFSPKNFLFCISLFIFYKYAEKKTIFVYIFLLFSLKMHSGTAHIQQVFFFKKIKFYFVFGVCVFLFTFFHTNWIEFFLNNFFGKL